MTKLNDSLGRVRIGEDEHVPIETNRRLWLFWITKSGDWDAEAITRSDAIISALSNSEVINVFCIWHGEHRTDLFLMDKEDLIKRLKSITKGNLPGVV